MTMRVASSWEPELMTWANLSAIYEPFNPRLRSSISSSRMPKGAIIGFDELDQAACPDETQAARDTVGIRNLRIQRFPYATALSYAVLD